MSGGVHCFTSFTFGYLARARVLAESIRKFHPEWTLWALISDRPPPGLVVDWEFEHFDRVVFVDELESGRDPGWVFGHDLVELCTAVKGEMLSKLLAGGAEKVLYLDPDIALFHSLNSIAALLDEASIVLTPHVIAPEEAPQAIDDNEIGTLRYGTYNLGFLGVRNDRTGEGFARWWTARLKQYCIDDVSKGLFTDQRWCDLVPGMFPSVHILRDPGCNVASWNLSQRTLKFDSDGGLTVNGSMLKFFHFTKILDVGETMLLRYAADNSIPIELMLWYRRRLVKHQLSGLPRDWWCFAKYSNGEAIPRAHRRAYRADKFLQSRYPDPFLAEPGGFLEWAAARPAS